MMRAVVRVWFVPLLAYVVSSAAAAPPLIFSGNVVDVAAQPVAEAEVLLLAYPSGQKTAPADVKTDAAGAFSFESELYSGSPRGPTLTLLVRKPGLAMTVAEAYAGVPVTLRLGDHPQTRSGIVLRPDGQPLANAEVVANHVFTLDGQGLFMGKSPPFLRAPTTTTDAQGRFGFDGFPRNLGLTVVIEVEGYAAVLPRLLDAEPTTVTLAPEATISGTVLANGEPQEGAVVSAYPVEEGTLLPRHATTNADGAYTFRQLAAGGWNVATEPPQGMPRLPRHKVTVKAGEAVTGVDLVFTPGALIRGKITDRKTGEAMPGIQVAALEADGEGMLASASSDRDGNYELRVSPGAMRIICERRPGMGAGLGLSLRRYTPEQLDISVVEVTVREGQVLDGQDLTTRLQGVVKGQALLPDGQPATGAKVRVVGPAGSHRQLAVNDAGRFLLPLPEAGESPPARPENRPGSHLDKACIVVTDSARNLVAISGQYPPPDSVTLTLQPAASLILSIVDQEGHPQPGYSATVGYPTGEHTWSGDSEGRVESDDQGIIRLTCLPPNVELALIPDTRLFRLMVGKGLVERNVVLKPGEERQLPPIVINPHGRSLQVAVTDADGEPVKGARVYAPNVGAPALADGTGMVELPGLAVKGEMTILAAHPTEEWYAAGTVDPDLNEPLRLIVRPLGKATGVLVAKEGRQPLEGWQVRCGTVGPTPPVGPEMYAKLGLDYRRYVTTDADGRWHFDTLIPALGYRVVARSPLPAPKYYGGSGVGAFVAAGGDQEQDAGVMEMDVVAEEQRILRMQNVQGPRVP